MKAVNEKLRRAVCSILALAMTLSLFSVPGFSGAALAAPEDSPSSETSAHTSSPIRREVGIVPYSSDITDVSASESKPTLYIDFLGDNAPGYTGQYIGTDGVSTAVPSDRDQSAWQAPNPPEAWKKYGPAGANPADCTPTTPGTVFWVGVGIDKMTLFELAKEGRGLTGLELGFYYNTNFVEPYTGANDAAAPYAPGTAAEYKSVLSSANLSASPNGLNQWNENTYEIVEAIPERELVMEEDTQEILFKTPTNLDMTAENGWKMLYVSLEKKDSAWGNDNRFANAEAADNDKINYVMMLPFVLKAYDPQDKICFRLSRNASLFSVGGAEYGAGIYDSANDADSSFGAWEKETRTPNHNLKEMFAFEGDLNIFTGENVPDRYYNALLKMPGVSTDPINNTAKLYPSSDPSIYIDEDYDLNYHHLSGLSMGDQLTLEVTKGAGITVGITITKNSAVVGSILTYQEVTPGSKFTFIMPDDDVTVTVRYQKDGGDRDDYKVELIKSDPNIPPLPENQAEIEGTDSAGISHTTNVSGGSITVAPDNTVSVDVKTHPDYRAIVEVKTKAGSELMVGLPNPGNPKYTFVMPSADVEVKVTYEELSRHYAELSVDAVSDVTRNNTAKLSFQEYSANGGTATTPVTLSKQLNGHDGGREELGPIPANREVRLDIHVTDDCIVSEIRLYNGDDSGRYDSTYIDLLASPGLTMTDSENGYLTFTMPDNRVQVHVVFAKLRDYNAKLFLQNGQSADMWGNKDGADDGSGPNPPEYNETDMAATPKQNTIQVWPSNKVTVDLKPDPGYSVESVTVTWGSNNKVVYTTFPGNKVEFTMPAADVNVFVKFRKGEDYNATLVLRNLKGGSVANAYDGAQTGWPEDTTVSPAVLDWPTKYGILEKDVSTAWVQVKPGWYIVTVRAVGLDSSPGGTGTGSYNGYPVASVSGNGYNNGLGGRVEIEVAQPSEDLTVYVEMRQGKPTTEPEYTLTLQVDDPDNTAAPLVNNWAQVKINGVGPQPTPEVSLANANNYYLAPNATYSDPIHAGQEVEVIYHAEPGYRVTGVSVTPTGFGIIPTPAGSDKMSFKMPAGSTVVTVHFEKIDPDEPAPYTATLHVIGAMPGEWGSLTNTVSGVTDKIVGTSNPDQIDGTPIPAWMGDKFETDALLAGSSHWVTVDVYQGGSAVPWTEYNYNRFDGKGEFIMPAGNVDVYMNFGDTEPPTPNQHKLSLTAYGSPTGTSTLAVGQAGEVDLTVDGVFVGTAQSDQSPVPTITQYVPESDTVLLSIRPNTGYVVDHIVYTPTGTVSPVELAALPAPANNRVVRFAMPANATGVEVYFREEGPDGPNKHTANIVLRMEDNPNAIVDTSVVGDAQFDNLIPGGGYSKVAAAGTRLDIEAMARNGYYISKIEITPATLGVAGGVTGVFANQNIDFIMPDADCTVNVYFRKGWPDEAELRATLNVHGPSGVPNNNARLFNTTTGTSAPSAIIAGESQSLPAQVGQEMKVKISVEPGYTLVIPISVKDTTGATVPYWRSGVDEISFRMPNTLVTVDVTFEKEDPDNPVDLKATLYNTTASTTEGELTRTTDNLTTSVVTAGNNGQITTLKPGEPLQITVTNVPTGKEPVVLVRTVDGVVVTVPAWTEVGGVYTTSFPMQDKDVEVYLIETDKPGVLPDEYQATLVVNEYNTTVSDPANQASMSDDAPALMTTTGTVSAVGTAAIRAVAGDTVTVHVDGIAPGYTVRSVEVRSASGTLLTLARPDGDTYTYTMPYENATAVVTFEKVDPDKALTAQVVVNNGGGVGNNAVIRKMGDSAPGVVKLDGLHPIDQIEVLITVQPGYRVQIITARATDGQVVSVSPLPLSPEQSPQNVNFFMPNNDVIVYVSFVTSDKLHRIIMDVVDHTTPSPNLSNTAALHTGYSGWSAYINDPATPVTAQGSVNDMVQVKINPQNDYYAVVTAVSDDANATPVPDLTKDLLVDPTGKTFTFSVPSSDVKVTVDYYPDSVPKPQHKVRLHITGVDGLVGKNILDYCVLPDTAVWQVTNTANTTSAPTVMEITVDYLETLEVLAKAKTGCYVKSAFAKVGNTQLNADPGTTVYTPATAPFTEKTFKFTMQNSDVDVYMVFTDDQNPVGPYTASLTVVGPNDVDWRGNPVYGAAGSAVLTNTSAAPTAIKTNTVLSNQPYNPATDSVTADVGHTLTVDVSVNPGYSIDRVVVTPLGLLVTPNSVTTDAVTGVKTYTYTMPAGDINIDVRLKSDDIDRHKVTLHLADAYLTANPGAATSVNSAKVSYTVYELTTDGASMNVPNTQYVCVETNPSAGYYVYRAYAVTQSGTVLPLVDKAAPTIITPLQHPSTIRKAWFEMPAEDVDVYIDFTTEPPFGDYSAILTVLDSDPTHASFATMTVERSAGLPAPTVRDDSNPGSSAPISVNALETIKGTLHIATGWALESITVTGSVAGGTTPTITLTPNPTNPNEYTFTMPAHDVGVVVKLKSVPVDGYKAILHIVDHSSAVGNQVTMKDTVGGLSVNTDGGTITRLKGNELIKTTVTPQPNVVIRSVIVTDDTGSQILPSTAVPGVYDYTMNNHDVDITVVLDNDDPDVPDMFLALVEKTGAGAAVAGNTAAITNTSNPALPNGPIWTGIYGETPMQRLRVDVSAVPGYNVTITARTKDGTGQEIPVAVSQLGVVGTVVGYLDVPSTLYDNVIITVDYGNTSQTLTQDLSLEIIDPNADLGNTAEVKELSATKLQVNGSTHTTDGPTSIQKGTTLSVTTNIAVGYLKKVELISNGVSLTLSVNNGVATFRMPNAAAKVVVTLAEGTQTPRPHDNLHDDNFGGASNPLYIDGYLTGQNLGGNRARIQVPNLYNKDLTPTTIPAFNEPANKYDYKLYLKSGESYVELIKGVDYDITGAGSYAPGAANATTGVTDPNTGWDFQIRSLKGESALSELLLKGGVLYITATDVTDPANPLAESEYVEVVLGPDANRGKFTATLKIVDSSGLPTGANQASMTINSITVTNDGDQIRDLQGNELIRTLAKPATGARVSAVTVTDSGGTRLLDQVPPGMDPERFPYYMTGEDVVITVYFEADKDPDNPDATHYIAAVSKHGEISVPGNDASIKNDSRDDLKKGSIWAEGNENNAMRVTVTVAAGYYATVTAYRKDNGDPIGVAVFGAGPGVISFDSLFTMPASDVQVDVTFTTKAPENLKNDLTLKLMGNYGTEPLNAARMESKGSAAGIYVLEADADVTTIAINTSDTEAAVHAGTLFDLTTSHATDYYIEKVLVKVTTTPATAPITLTLDTAGEYKDFAMPLGETVVEVYFKEKNTEPRTPRPYNPFHSVAYNSANYPVPGVNPDLSSPTQEGWILATGETPDANGKKRVKVLVPTLHDDDHTPINDVAALENANILPTGEYKFYWHDGFGYRELVQNVDIAVVGKDAPSAYTAANGIVFTGYEMTLTALLPGSTMEYYINHGGKIYVTSNKAPGATPSQESDYTQVIIPKTYTATLHYKLEDGGVEVPGTGAKMTAWSQVTTTDNDTLSGTNGTEVVKVSDIVVPSGYQLDGVVATTVAGTVNVLEGSTPGQYEYTMVNEDVDIYVVYKKTDDPLRDKGPWIATVIKKNDGGMTGNSATIKDVDVAIPDYQKGKIWTAAYEGNVVRVDVTTEPGWYAIITAKTAGANGPVHDVSVSQFATGTQNFYGLFYMADDHVDVTVEYIGPNKPLPEYDLTLKVVGADGVSANSATITLPSGATMVANGTAQLAGPDQVAANTILDLTTTAGPSHSVASVKMEINGNGILIDIPLVDGDSVPDPVMPMGNTVITVTFQRGAQTARPYDPLHSVAYNSANYPVAGTNPDLSETGMEGWILAERKDDSHFKITVPTLHNKGTAAPGNLYHAGDDSNLPTSQPTYKLYWKDSMGVFYELKDGVDITITIPSDPIIEDIYSYGGVDYDGYTFDVAVNLVNPNGDPNPTVGTFWGGYSLQEYIKNGGSIYITATGGASVSRDPQESEKTEVVFSRTDTFTATIHYGLVDNTSGTPVTVPTAATMSEGTTDVTVDGGKITGLDGDELIRVHSITKPAGYRVVGVVATTDAGTQNVLLNAGNSEYEYTMVHKDVDLYVVYEREDDPLRDKGPWIATVIKEDDGGESANTAAIKDMDVVIPDHQKGDIWTTAYEGNVVRVDVTTAPGWYAVITAETVGANGPKVKVPVATYTTGPQNFYGLFYMADDHVNVTVKYVHGDMPSYELTLEKVDANAVSGNMATLEADGVGSATVDGATLTNRVPDASTPVPAGTKLKLTTAAAAGYHVSDVKMIIDGFPTPVDVPLIDNVSLPEPLMPMGNAKVVVTFDLGDKTARPYNPDHSKAYNSAYPNAANPDLSQTHMDGWLLAEKDAADTTGTKFSIHVPTLHNNKPAAPGTLYHAGDASDQPTYRLYWKDNMGIFHELKDGVDIDITGKRIEGVYPNGGVSYNGYTLDVEIKLVNPSVDPNANTVGTFWGGYSLQEYMRRGGSIYITSTGGASGSVESEKTEVVFKSEEFKATLHIVNHSSHPTPGDVSMTDSISVVTEDGKSFGTSGDATIKTTVKPNAGVVIRSVIATDAGGSHVLTGVPVSGGFEYTYTMDEHDVDITVVFDNDDDDDVEKMYLAIVEKTGEGLELSDNTAAITNTTNPALPKGDIWTGIYGERPKQRVQVDVTTAAGYYAVVTAATKNGSGANVSVPVLQIGNTGTVTAYVDIPSDLYDDVIITVNYTTTQPTDEFDLELEMIDPNASASNTADINDAANLLHVDGTSLTDGPKLVQVGAVLNVGTNVLVGSLLKVELEANGITTVLMTMVGGTDFAMPNGDAKVTVTLLEADKRTPRPHDNLHHNGFVPGAVNATPYIEGYLDGQNLGGNTAIIPIPNLLGVYSSTFITVPASNDLDKKYDYKLYLKNGSSYVELKKGVDYDVTMDGSYDPGVDNAIAGAATPNTGWELQIRSLKGESALTELMLNGGVLYITATDVTDPTDHLAESEYVEVVLPADPNKPDPDDPTKGYKATLWVVDNSGVSGNTAGMFIDSHTPVNYTGTGAVVDASQGDITQLLGNEAIRTTAQAAAGARVSAVTVTDANGTRLLPEIPDGMDPKRFLHYMTGEDVVITVYFEAEDDPDDPDDTRFIAAVAKYGATAVPGNDATIKNTTRSDLLKGNIWTEGYETNDIEVTVSLAIGYYAQVEAIKMSDGSSYTITVNPPGPGPGTATDQQFTVDLVMPASDVQIKVTFVRELDNDLQPYDPANTGSSVYADHWITSENQGDRLVVVVPELNKKDGSEDTEVDKAKHDFHFYMKVDSNAPESLENVINLSHPDPTDTSGDPYENGIYYPDPATAAGAAPTKYHGARFILTVKTDDEIDNLVTTNAITAAEGSRAKELAALLRAIMDNAGTENSIASGVDVDLTGSGTPTNYKCRLYITHTDSTDASFESEQVDFEIPRYYSLTGVLESYAPAHIADLTLELFDDNSGKYVAPTYDYDADTPYHIALALQERKIGNGLWEQDFTFKSSKLAGKKYQFVAKKAAHITYKRPEVSLTIADAPAGRYDADTLTFSFDAPIGLIAGDIDGNQQVKFRDWDYLLMYMYGPAEWTTIVDETAGTPDEWAISVYNPESGAYAADLTGDGRIDGSDEMVLMNERNYNRSARHYNSPKGLDLNAAVAPPVTTFMMSRSMKRMALAVKMDAAGPEAIEEEDELSIPEWAAELVRAGVRVPMWAIELIRLEMEMPEWALEIIYSEQTMPEWALALLRANEALPEWAMELIGNGEALPAEPLQPKPEKEEKTYIITSDTEIRPIKKPDVTSESKPENEKDTYIITSDTDIKTIEKPGEPDDQEGTEGDDKGSQAEGQPDGKPEAEIEDMAEPSEEAVLEAAPQGEGCKTPGNHQEMEEVESALPDEISQKEQA